MPTIPQLMSTATAMVAAKAMMGGFMAERRRREGGGLYPMPLRFGPVAIGGVFATDGGSADWDLAGIGIGLKKTAP